jgi:hypothetical protein
LPLRNWIGKGVAGRVSLLKEVETKVEPFEAVLVVTVPIGREASLTPEIVTPFAVTLAGFAVKRM